MRRKQEVLPSSLLITRRRKTTIRPIYAQLDEDCIDIAALLTHTYRSHVGKPKGELNDAVDQMEQDLRCDYRYLRGLATLLDRRCQLEPKTTMSPVKARREVFTTANVQGVPTSPQARQSILDRAAGALGVTVEEVEEALYGDLEDELILTDFRDVNPEALVKQYNLSLTQTLLFYCTELTFTTRGNWQRIFRQIKWLGLIYNIWSKDGEYEVTVDGPASLFKLNRRYGTRLAQLLPTIVENRDWSLRAKILRHQGERRLLDLELDSRKQGRLMEALERPERTDGFDSQVEQDFANRFRMLHTGWTLTREPEPLPVGRGVMIPDFGLQKSGQQVYLEVAGFWTPQYLEEKTRKLALLGDVDMIVAADRDLACQKLEQIGKKLNVIYYKRRIPLKPILAHLKTREARMVKEQTQRLRTRPLPIEDPIVDAKELAEKIGVLEDAVLQVLREREVPGYIRLWDMLIKESTLDTIRQMLETRLSQGELSLDEAARIVEDAGGRRTANILDALGYKVEWCGIDPQSTKIRRKK